jgi:tetratricopeptide (TPR) repeat protein
MAAPSLSAGTSIQRSIPVRCADWPGLVSGAVLAAGAIAQYEQALRLKPGLAEVHVDLGYALEKRPGRLNEAIAQFEEALRLKPYAAFHLNLAFALLKTPGRSDEAVAHLKAVLRLEPENEAARRILAEIQAPGP